MIQVLGALVGIGIAIYHINQQNQLHSVRCSRQSPPQGWNQSLINKKPPKIYNTGICPICFEKIDERNALSSILKCGHVYHNDCLGELIKKQHKQCPECREDIELYNP